jgi:hypothetical protein
MDGRAVGARETRCEHDRKGSALDRAGIDDFGRAYRTGCDEERRVETRSTRHTDLRKRSVRGETGPVTAAADAIEGLAAGAGFATDRADWFRRERNTFAFDEWFASAWTDAPDECRRARLERETDHTRSGGHCKGGSGCAECARE